MFWKKDPSPVFVELNTDNVRRAYRVTPGPHTPITLLIDGRQGRVLNISVAGIAFALQDSPDPPPSIGQTLQAVLIPGGGDARPIPMEVEIIDRQGDQFRGRLIPTTDRAQKDLGHYVVTHQKQEIRRQAGKTGNESHALLEDGDSRG